MVKNLMYKIIEAKELTSNIFSMVVEAPRVAKNCQPGQFVIVRMDKDGERIPLTICDYDRAKGTITIVFQSVGAETTRMAVLKAGDKRGQGGACQKEDFIRRRRSRHGACLSAS